MRPDDAVLEVVRVWMAKAEGDLENATIVLRAGADGPLDTVAFHAQQCAEKYLKALMCFRGEEVPRIHDVEALLARTGIGSRVEVTLEESRLLTDYATVTLSRGPRHLTGSGRIAPAAPPPTPTRSP
jgi:HEPN domain-containing protein